MPFIVATLDSKMLQDTVAGMIITSRRPHVVEENSFVEQRLNKTEHRKKELEVLVQADDVPEGLTDKKFAKLWNELSSELQENRKAACKAIIKDFMTEDRKGGRGKKEDDRPPPPPPAPPAPPAR